MNDKWLRIIGITLMMWMSVSVNDYFSRPFTWNIGLQFLLSLLTIVGTWHVSRFVILTVRQRYPKVKQIFWRLILSVFLGVLANALVFWPTNLLQYLLLHQTLRGFEKQQRASFTINNHELSLWAYGVDLVEAGFVFLFFWILYESILFVVDSRNMINRLRKAEREKEILEKVNLQSQLEALKQQVNPHFLFNSLNALGSLIEDDPKQAAVFLEELSTVYRYLLRSNDQNLITLAAELDFIHSYTHLLQTRYGAGLQLLIEVEERCKTYQIPPLTLQLLVENAVKHNKILQEAPLTITIATDTLQQLAVTNNLQRKNSRIHSNGVGLNNILTKYKMLGLTLPVIEEDESRFSVLLPLIQPAG
ncbi:MAG: histidine kinase [Spirosomataceae bacterium]